MLVESSWSCGGTERSLTMAPTDPADLAAIRLCERLDWDNLWESRGGSMVNGAPREFPKSTRCTP